MPRLEGEKTRYVTGVEKGGYRIAGNELGHYRSMAIVYQVKYSLGLKSKQGMQIVNLLTA